MPMAWAPTIGRLASKVRMADWLEVLPPSRAREGGKTSSQSAMRTFEASRPIVGAQAIGIARAAYEFALDYAKERNQFGRAIIENQAIAFMLADMATEI